MTRRVFNFNPGPATLPFEVIRQASQAVLEYDGQGMSLIEMSHRSKQYDKINAEAEADMKKIMGLGDDYRVLFMGGGASLQFSMVPMNFLRQGQTADYVNTGAWASKAIKEAKKEGSVNVAASSEDRQFAYIPKTFNFTKDASYVHVTSNNTIYGTEWQTYPETNGVPLIVDMSSDILSRKLDYSKFDLIYAGAQKNLGPAGVTIIIAKKDFIDSANDNLPTMLSYKTHAAKNSLFNTPPVFPVYVVGLVLKWILEKGGLDAIEKINTEKAKLLYDMIDANIDFYSPNVDKDGRSKMNVTFRLVNRDLEAKFVEEAKAQDLIGLKGHRDAGGIRASLYNALPLEGVKKLTEFMEQFKKDNK